MAVQRSASSELPVKLAAFVQQIVHQHYRRHPSVVLTAHPAHGDQQRQARRPVHVGVAPANDHQRRRRQGDRWQRWGNPHAQTARTRPDDVTMFEQRDRWLEELREHTRHSELVTCTSGYMPLCVITAEIAEACVSTTPSAQI